MNAQFVSSSSHFHYRQLKTGVFAALARPEGLAGSNCGIVDLGGRTVIIDTSLSPQAGQDLRDTARELTGQPADLVLLTHHHYDHLGGCQVFDEKTTLFSTDETYHLIADTGAVTLANHRAACLQTLQSTQDGLALEQNTEKRREMQKLILDTKERLNVLNSTKIRLPDCTCRGPVVIYGTERRLEFIPFRHAHCPGNAVAWLPQDGVIFMGDLLFARRHPYMTGCDPLAWQEVLQVILDMQPEIVIPGHGGLSAREEIRLEMDYFVAVTQAVQKFIRAGKPASELGEIKLTEPFNLWEPKALFAASLEYLYSQFSE